MNTFEVTARDRAREIFGEIQDAEALLHPASLSARRMNAARLYAAAKDDALHVDAGPAVRRAHSLMVADSARFTLPFARAASSGSATARRGDGCHIRIEQSRAEPDQYFVVVELAKGLSAGAPLSLVVCDQDDRCRRFPLPAARNGVAQIIADAGSDLMRLISDPGSKVYLR